MQPPTTNAAVGRVNAQVLAAMAQIPVFDERFVWQYYRLKGAPTSDETAFKKDDDVRMGIDTERIAAIAGELQSFAGLSKKKKDVYRRRFPERRGKMS